jgi:hydroxyacylglutathione hydrolase
LRTAEESGMKIRYVVDTHVHADHISGGRKLAEITGARYVLHASSLAGYEFFPVEDGDNLDLGNVQVGILHTPGHTPEHISLLVTDKTRGPEPWFLLSGHTLMVGDLGRTELASSAEQGARSLFETVQKLKSLPDYLEVLPGAFSGSVCGRSLSGKRCPRLASSAGSTRPSRSMTKISLFATCYRTSPRHQPTPRRFETSIWDYVETDEHPHNSRFV